MPPKRTVLNENSSSKDDGDANDGFQNDIRRYLELPMGEETMSFAGVVDDNSSINSGEWQLGPRGSNYITMAQFLRSDPEGYKILGEEIEQVAKPFFDYFSGEDINLTSRYISDVFCYRGRKEYKKIMDILRSYGGSRRTGMFGYSVEDDHIHIIHDCSYSGRTCRCTFKEKIESFGEFRPTRRYNKPIWKFTRTDWYDVFVYFFLAKRGTREVWFRGKNWKIPNDSELVRWEEIYNSRRSLVRFEDSGSDSECVGQTHKRSRRAIDSGSDNEVYGKKSKFAGKYSYIKSKTKALLLKYYCSPISAIRDINEFREDCSLSDPKNRDYLQAAFDDFGKDLNAKSMRELENLLNNAEPIFMKSMQYGTMEESFEWINDLIRYQCNDNDEEILHFLNSLIDILDMKLSKTNAFLVFSPPSAGKNFFFDMIFSICLNYGQLGQANKHNVFAFQEAPNKRVLIWNEPNYESALTDTLKMMFAGDPFTVRVKHVMDTHVSRTPVIILTNTHVPFMSDIAFRDRIVVFRWKEAPQLKDIHLKPYPLSFFSLLKHYNIEYYICV